MSELYKNAPLIEAVFEIRFPAELSIECHRDEYYSKVKEEFPQIFVPAITGVEAPSLKSYEFKSKDNSKLLKNCINRFSYHTMRYLGFAAFKEECLHYMQSFTELYKISSLKRTGLRYINHMPIVKIDGCIPIERYLNFGYQLPSEKIIPDKFELFHTILVLNLGEGKLRILIQYDEIQDIVKTEVIILDFDYYIEGKLDAELLEHYLDDSHKHTKIIFESLISDEYRKVMEGGE